MPPDARTLHHEVTSAIKQRKIEPKNNKLKSDQASKLTTDKDSLLARTLDRLLSPFLNQASSVALISKNPAKPSSHSCYLMKFSPPPPSVACLYKQFC